VDNGIATGAKPSTASTNEFVGMPLAIARNVPPSHGKLVAANEIGPADPVQPAP
jgi:hypothetical protein